MRLRHTKSRNEKSNLIFQNMFFSQKIEVSENWNSFSAEEMFECERKNKSPVVVLVLLCQTKLENMHALVSKENHEIHNLVLKLVKMHLLL